MTSKLYDDSKADYKKKYFRNVSDSYAAEIIGTENEPVVRELFVDYAISAPKFDDISDENQMIVVEGSALKLIDDLKSDAKKDLRQPYGHSAPRTEDYVQTTDHTGSVYADKGELNSEVYQNGSDAINRTDSQNSSYGTHSQNQTTQEKTYDLRASDSPKSSLITDDTIPASQKKSDPPSTVNKISNESKAEKKSGSLSDKLWAKSTNVFMAVRDTGTFISRKSIDNVLVDSLRDLVNNTEKEFNSFNQRVSKIFSKR